MKQLSLMLAIGLLMFPKADAQIIKVSPASTSCVSIQPLFGNAP